MVREDRANMLSVADAGTGEESVAARAGGREAGVESIRAATDSGVAAAAEKPALGELQAAAGAFNAVFDSVLSELESTRSEIEERSARIAELDETVGSLRGALDDEIGKGRKREEEYRQQTGELGQRIQAAESERDLLQKKVRDQERTLEERSSEMSELFARIEDLKTGLEERTAAGEKAQEEFANEKRLMSAKLGELQALYDGANNQLKAQQQELEESNRELGILRDQLTELRAGIESRDAEATRLNRQVADLQGVIETQTEAMREESESNAAAREELNTSLSGMSAELETLRATHDDLRSHAENLERLNQALHESSITEQKVHRQQLDERAAEIELLRSRLDGAGESAMQPPESMAETTGMKQILHRLETDLEELRAQNQELGQRAAESDRLEDLNVRLRTALDEAREKSARAGGESQNAQPLQTQLADLQAALDAARNREEELAGKLHDFEALEQEVIGLRAAAAVPGDGQEMHADTGEAYTDLQREVENLRVALSASEEKCRQLHAAYSSSAGGGESGVVLQVVPDKPQDTAAPGRSRFIAQLDELLAGRGDDERQYSLMYLLLDNFVSIRDEVGVVESESVVSEVAAIIEAGCAAEDVMARFGDCTFAVLCRNAGVEETEERAAAIRSTVEARIFEQDGRSLVTTTSIGICSIRKNDASAKEVISRADLACEAARLSGGNRVIASSAIADEMTIRGSDEDHRDMVRRTIEEERIKTYYQPISSLREQTANHFEVLIRLVDESGDMILPGEFFAMAEGAGYADAVDRYVIENTIKVISAGSDQQVRFFVKLTRQSVADEALADWVAQKIGEYGVRAEQLVFEIAEHIMQGDLGHVARLSESLNEIGCQIAIEHYRMSTSRQHLMHVHTDYLKIDRGLIGGIEGKGESLAKITEIMELAKNNNCITIAEGVETPGCLAMLWELGVSMAQGYFIQAPAADREYVDHDIIGDSHGDAGSKASFEIG